MQTTRRCAARGLTKFTPSTRYCLAHESHGYIALHVIISNVILYDVSETLIVHAHLAFLTLPKTLDVIAVLNAYHNELVRSQRSLWPTDK